MIDKQKRQTISTLAAGVAVTAVPKLAFGAASPKHKNSRMNHGAYSGDEYLYNVRLTVSTLGKDSAITTISNNSSYPVTITSLYPEVIEHSSGRFNINAAIGSAGIRLKPGQQRMLIARKPDQALT